MEGKRSKTKPSNLLKKIKEITRSILEDLRGGRSPSLFIDRFRSYCMDSTGNCFFSSDLSTGKEFLTIQKESHARRLDVLLRVQLIVQQLLQENKHGSKRDIYYMHPSVFREQSVVDRAINDICILLRCSRHNLNVVSAGNGLVMGWLRFLEAERKFDCISSLNTAHPVPVHVEEVKDIVSVAQYILVVEKESVFQRLANDQFCNRNCCIIITGRGYPDVPTRRFLRLLVEKTSLPTYCLVDCDPYGFDILTTYCFGSMQMAYDAKFLRVPAIHWLGAFPLDSEKYGLPQQCLLPLTAEGLYSVTIDVDEGLAKISREVDSSILLSALGRSGKHAELKWVKLESLAPKRGYYDDGHNLYNNNYYGQGCGYRTMEKSYRNTRSTLHEGMWCDSHQRYWPRSLLEFFSYNYSSSSGSHYYPYDYPMHGHNMM